MKYYVMDQATGTTYPIGNVYSEPITEETIFPWIHTYAEYLTTINVYILTLLLIGIAVLVIFILLKHLGLFDITERQKKRRAKRQKEKEEAEKTDIGEIF